MKLSKEAAKVRGLTIFKDAKGVARGAEWLSRRQYSDGETWWRYVVEIDGAWLENGYMNWDVADDKPTGAGGFRR